MAINPGPTSVFYSYSAGERPLTSLWDRRDFLISIHSAHKERIKTVTDIVNGNWYTVWPDLTRTPEAPTVANLVEMGIAHWSSIGGAMLPSIKVPTPVALDQSEGRRGARKRERRLRELWDKSSVSEKSSMMWGDYAGAGVVLVGAWANFSEDDKSKRDPYLVRFDPRFTYPLKDDLGNVTELLVARRISKQTLANMWPEHKALFEKSREEDIEEWFWYLPDRFLHVVVDVSSNGRKKRIGTVLTSEENKLGFVPVHETVRPTFDGERRGVFDQTLNLLRTMHRLMTLTIYSTEEQAFPAILEFDIVNPGQFGPGAIISARSAEGKLERIQPSQHFDVKDLIARLSEEAKMQSTWPQQLSGEPGASINSARGIQASMGALDARLNLAHKQFEELFATASKFLLAMDEIYCDGEKTIYGGQRDRAKAETFVPSRDIAGAWEVACTYGIGAGSDPASKEMRLLAHISSGLVSLTTAREQLDFLDDPELEPIRQTRELAQQAVLQGVLAMAGQGDPSMAAELFKALQTEDVDLDEVLEKLVQKMLEPVEPAPLTGPGQGGDPAAALMEAESLARGGIPGNAEQGPSGAQSFGLPPMSNLLGQDSRQVI